MKAWFNDPQQLIRADQVTQFWPTSEQTPEDRVNAASRFIIYVSCILYLTRRDPRIFVLGATVIAVIFVLYKSKMVKETYGIGVNRGKCQMPTEGGLVHRYPSIFEMLPSVNSFRTQSQQSQEIRQSLLSGSMAPKMVQCVRVAMDSVIPTPVVSKGRLFLVSAPMETSGRECLVDRLIFLCNNKWRISSNLVFPSFKTKVLSPK